MRKVLAVGSIFIALSLFPVAGQFSWVPPAGATGHEGQIVGGDNQTPIGNAAAVWQARGRPVARISRPDGQCGTGFMIDQDCLLTCAHVVEGQPAANLTAEFVYQDVTAPYQRSGNVCPGADAGCNPPEVWTTNTVQVISPSTAQDCAIIKLNLKNGQHAGDAYGNVTVRAGNPVVGEKVHVIGHPDGRCKEYSHDAAAVVIALADAGCGGAGWFSHGADTEGGSSGSPVFGEDGCVIGKHCAAAPGLPVRNCAIAITAIRGAVENKGCAFKDWSTPTTTEPSTWGTVKGLFR